MFCANCGKKVEDGAKFCPGCGTKVGAAPASKKDTPNNEVVPAAQALIKKGKEYYEEGDYDNAVAAFGKAIKIAKDYPDVYLLRAWAFYYDNREKKAIKDLDKVIELDPNNFEAFYLRGVSNYERDAFEMDEDTSNNEAQALLDMNEDDKNNMVKDKIEQAIMDLSVAIVLKDDYVEAYKMRATIYHFQENYEDEVEDYTKLLELEPGEAKHYRARGLAYSLQGETETAIQDFTKEIEADPENFDAWFNRGCALFDNDDNENALPDFNKALLLSPGNPAILGMRGLTYFQQKKFDLALADYNEALEVNQDEAALYLSRASVYFFTKRFVEGQEDYEHAWWLDHNIPGDDIRVYTIFLTYSYENAIKKIGEDDKDKKPWEHYIITAYDIGGKHYVGNSNTPTYEGVNFTRYDPPLRFLTKFDAERYCYELNKGKRGTKFRVEKATTKCYFDIGCSFYIMRGTTGEIITDVAEDGELTWERAGTIWDYTRDPSKSTQEDPLRLLRDVLLANEDMTDLYLILHTNLWDESDFQWDEG